MVFVEIKFIALNHSIQGKIAKISDLEKRILYCEIYSLLKAFKILIIPSLSLSKNQNSFFMCVVHKSEEEVEIMNKNPSLIFDFINKLKEGNILSQFDFKIYIIKLLNSFFFLKFLT